MVVKNMDPADLDIEMDEDDDLVRKLSASGVGVGGVIPPGGEDTAKEDDNEGVGHMEDEAKKRKDRLRAFRQKLIGGDNAEKEEEAAKKGGALPKPVFRSYNPTHDKFQDASVPKAKAIDIEEQIADTLEHAVVKPVIEDVDLTSLAPRKPDWDLKRDVAPKLAKLERRTQKAIAELILERLENNKQNLAAAVEFSNPNERNVEDDED